MTRVTLEQANKLFKVDYAKDGKKRYKNAKREYRRLAKEYHPDAGGTKEDFQIIQEAWELIEKNINERKPKKAPAKASAYTPKRKKDRNINTLFKGICKYFDEKEGKHISLIAMSQELKLTAPEYLQVESWISSFQHMRYIIGSKVNFIPPDLTLRRLEKAIDHVNQGNYGSLPDLNRGHYNTLPMSLYRALAKGIRKGGTTSRAHFDFDLEDWEKE